MRRKALCIRARDSHVQPALRIFVNVRRRRVAFRRPTALVGISWRVVDVDVVEALEAAAAVSSWRFLFRGRWRRLLWRWWRERQGRIGIGRSRGSERLRFLPRQWFDDFVDGRRFFIVIGCGLYIVIYGPGCLRLLDLDQPISDATLGGDGEIRRPRRWRGDDGDELFERAKSLRYLAHKLIMQMRDDVIVCGFEAQHCVAEHVAADRLCCVLGDQPAECAALLEEVVPLPSPAAGITEREAAARIAVKADVFVEARIGVADASVVRQFKMEESLVALKRDAGGGEALVVFAPDGVHRLT